MSRTDITGSLAEHPEVVGFAFGATLVLSQSITFITDGAGSAVGP